MFLQRKFLDVSVCPIILMREYELSLLPSLFFFGSYLRVITVLLFFENFWNSW